jgi:FlaA1/EpsC-like NDP-sugar epimerase
MSMDEAVNLNLFALNNTIGGEIFIPKLKATTIMAFAETFAPGVPVEFIGLRGYEKIHEDLISDTEMLYVVDLGKYYKIVPPGVTDWTLGWDISYPDEPRAKPFKYASNAVEQFTTDELKEFDDE